MHVLLLTHSYSPEHSPPQRRWTSLIRRFREMNWEIDVLAPVAHFPFGRRVLPKFEAGRPWRRQTGQFGERILRVPYLRHGESRPGRLMDQVFSAFMCVPAALFLKKPDVVIVTAPSLATLGPGFLLARLRKIPLVVEMRDAWPDLAIDSRVVQGRVKSIVNSLIMAIQFHSDLVVCVTDGFANTLRARGVSPVVTISNGVETSRVPVLKPPPVERERLEVLYMGNHGESQRLEVVIRASALVGDSMRLTMVGHGTQRQTLMELAEALKAPADFHLPVYGAEVLELYRYADSCVISLRDDWKSFETTVPSKTYEVMATGRHVTGIVLGEASRILRESQAGDVVASRPEDIAKLWCSLVANRALLRTGHRSREWVEEYADYSPLSAHYTRVLERVVADSRGGPA